MPRPHLLACILGISFLGVGGLCAGEEPKSGASPEKPKARTVEQLAASCRPSLVVITGTGRDGKPQGLGSGFVVSADGLIVTNMHVIGDGRPITVELVGGKKHEVIAVHATDRASDLAIIRIDAKDLVPLPLGDSDTLKDGQAVVALGNPQGLKNSVVAGVVSGRREIDSLSMIQLAIPIEAGNSGGPLVNLEGQVQGILTMKSLVTANLGFAVPSNAVRPLLQKPNPVPMARWLTIGALNTDEWTPLFGARWRQRAGRIQVDASGKGFGGRSLCLAKQAVPEVPFEIAVTVRLDDEAGAAGLAFHADGEDKHYGFYPTNGRLRLTRFEGPDVYSWKVLDEKASPHYRAGEWNVLKVRIEKEKFLCYVNDQLVIESTDNGLTKGKAGLAKFRETRAEFKNFQVAQRIPPAGVSPEMVARIGKLVQDIAPQKPPRPELVDKLVPDGPASMAVLRDRAKMLEQQASQLRELAQTVHVKRVQAELQKVLGGKEPDIDLLHAGLLVARLDNDELDVEAYRKEVDRIAKEIVRGLAKDADDKAKLAGLTRYMFEEHGFHGSRADYYHKSNSYLNEVIDDREGLPITLSVLFMELGRRIGLKIEGVGLPGHFVVRHVPAKGEPELIDVYDNAKPMTREQAERIVRGITDQPLRKEHLAAVTKRAMIVRMLQNLLGLAREEGDPRGMLRYVDTIITINPDAGEERFMRAVLRYQANDKQGALEDTDWVIEHEPEGVNLRRVRDFREILTRPER